MIDEKFGFIMLRHVSKSEHNLLWIECYKCIRKFYKNKIVIIDDNSNKKLISNINLENTQIINSKLNGRGEILPYYFLIKNNLFEKAFILHDSMFINEKLNFKFNDFKFLWHASSHNGNNRKLILESFTYLRESKKKILINKFNDKKNWFLCFGGCSVITLDFLKKVQREYRITSLLKFSKSRVQRMALERTLAIVFYNFKEFKNDDISIFGDILCYGKLPFLYTYKEYLNDKKNLKYPIIKVWNSR